MIASKTSSSSSTLRHRAANAPDASGKTRLQRRAPAALTDKEQRQKSPVKPPWTHSQQTQSPSIMTEVSQPGSGVEKEAEEARNETENEHETEAETEDDHGTPTPTLTPSRKAEQDAILQRQKLEQMKIFNKILEITFDIRRFFPTWPLDSAFYRQVAIDVNQELPRIWDASLSGDWEPYTAQDVQWAIEDFGRRLEEFASLSNAELREGPGGGDGRYLSKMNYLAKRYLEWQGVKDVEREERASTWALKNVFREAYGLESWRPVKVPSKPEDERMQTTLGKRKRSDESKAYLLWGPPPSPEEINRFELQEEYEISKTRLINSIKVKRMKI